MDCEDTMETGNIQKPNRGNKEHNMDFSFKPGERVTWSWHEMIAHMTPQTRDLVVNGPEGRSGGLLRCAVSRRQNSYSHQRCYAARAGQQLGPQKAGQHQAEYDFVVYRADGSAVRFHPEWTRPEFAIYPLTPHEAPVRPPPTGWGGEREAAGTNTSGTSTRRLTANSMRRGATSCFRTGRGTHKWA